MSARRGRPAIFQDEGDVVECGTTVSDRSGVAGLPLTASPVAFNGVFPFVDHEADQISCPREERRGHRI
jgi:hypothetical protein